MSFLHRKAIDMKGAELLNRSKNKPSSSPLMSHATNTPYLLGYKDFCCINSNNPSAQFLLCISKGLNNAPRGSTLLMLEIE